MKAIQYMAPGRAELVDVPVPEPGPGQVLLKVLGVATCPQWDLHLMDGVSMAPGGTIDYPTAPGHPGHEAVGEVVAVGDGVDAARIGTRAALWQDQGAGRDGCYAEYLAADVRNLLEVPDSFRADEVASLELAMCVQVSFDQILNIGPIEGKRIAVSGLGPAGLVALQLAKAYGAKDVVALDPVKSRRELALILGADVAMDPSDAEGSARDKFDAAIDCTGLAVSVEFLMRHTRWVVALFGVLRDEARFGFSNWCSGLHLVGYGQQNRGAAERALEHIRAGRLRLAPLISRTLPLTEYTEGIELLRSREAVKILFQP